MPVKKPITHSVTQSISHPLNQPLSHPHVHWAAARPAECQSNYESKGVIERWRHVVREWADYLPSGVGCLAGGWWMPLKCHHTLRRRRKGGVSAKPKHQPHTHTWELAVCYLEENSPVFAPKRNPLKENAVNTKRKKNPSTPHKTKEKQETECINYLVNK